MKSFKEFLREEMTATPGDAGSSKAQSAPSFQGSPLGTTPTLPGGWPYKPQEKPETEEKPEKPGQPPEPIDWEEIDDRVEDLYDRFKQIMDMMRALSWDAFLQWLSSQGITVPGAVTEGDVFDYFIQDLSQQLFEWFYDTYPDATDQQKQTFRQRLRDLDDRFGDLYVDSPPGTPGTPFGGADDPRYTFDIQDPTTWENIDPFHPDFQRPGAPPAPTQSDEVQIPWWLRIRRYGQPPYTAPSNPYPGTYEA